MRIIDDVNEIFSVMEITDMFVDAEPGVLDVCMIDTEGKAHYVGRYEFSDADAEKQAVGKFNTACMKAAETGLIRLSDLGCDLYD